MTKAILMVLFVLCCFSSHAKDSKPRVFVFTNININKGDPDDRQSLVHLFWYANALDIVGIVPDRWNAQGLEASLMAIEAYEKDYQKYKFKRWGYPRAAKLKDLLAKDLPDAIEGLRKAALAAKEKPLYVLVWGNMVNFGKALRQYPEINQKIRLITIGTGLKYGPEGEVAGEDCRAPNWNGPGRNEIYQDPRFKNMWWLEINWTYNGMFSGEGPKHMFEKLSAYGEMGQHLKLVTKDHPWAQYFRVGDTPSVLYLIDPFHNPDDPTKSGWAGKFKKPFPGDRQHYFTDDNGAIEWDYDDPCRTWNNLKTMYAYNKSTLEKERPTMYQRSWKKLNKIYGIGSSSL